MSSNGNLILESESADEARIREVVSLLAHKAPDEIEDGHLEVKGWCKDIKELFEKMSDSCSCLANGDGGILLLGIAEQSSAAKRFSTCNYKGLTLSLLSLKLSELTHPPVQCRFYDATDTVRELTPVKDANAFALIVPKSMSINGHMTTKGVSKVRVGKECKPNFTAEDDFTKKVIPGLQVKDLSSLSIAWAIANHERTYRTPRNHWSSDAEFLLQAELLVRRPDYEGDESQLLVTLAALLLFGSEIALKKHVGHCETVLKVGTSPVTLCRNIVDTFRHLCENRSSLLPSYCRDVGLETIRELVMNAYVHRCYRMASSVVITSDAEEFTIQSPGELAASLNPSELIYCVPVYRNLRLAEGCRFIGLSDKVGQGIDMVYRAVLSEGFDFPHFESGSGSFQASIPLAGSANFREFARKRSQSPTSLDEICVLRTLYAKSSTPLELTSSMQRGTARAQRVLTEMQGKQMIEMLDDGSFRLSSVIRADIEHIFSSDQMLLSIDAYGDLVA